MLRLVTNEGERVAPGSRGRVETQPADAEAQSAAAKSMIVCDVELCRIVATEMVEAMMRCGIARPEQAEAILTQLADRYDAIATRAPMHLREAPEWKGFAGRCEAAAADIRDHVFGMQIGDL